MFTCLSKHYIHSSIIEVLSVCVLIKFTIILNIIRKKSIFLIDETLAYTTMAFNHIHYKGISS